MTVHMMTYVLMSNAGTIISVLSESLCLLKSGTKKIPQKWPKMKVKKIHIFVPMAL